MRDQQCTGGQYLFINGNRCSSNQICEAMARQQSLENLWDKRKPVQAPWLLVLECPPGSFSVTSKEVNQHEVTFNGPKVLNAVKRAAQALFSEGESIAEPELIQDRGGPVRVSSCDATRVSKIFEGSTSGPGIKSQSFTTRLSMPVSFSSRGRQSACKGVEETIPLSIKVVPPNLHKPRASLHFAGPILERRGEDYQFAAAPQRQPPAVKPYTGNGTQKVKVSERDTQHMENPAGHDNSKFRPDNIQPLNSVTDEHAPSGTQLVKPLATILKQWDNPCFASSQPVTLAKAVYKVPCRLISQIF